tara:strand:- start:666 stop:1997 length:1332 start_codon:yes stop_codon:yes gene_type:complete
MSDKSLDLEYYENVVMYKSLTDPRYLGSIIDFLQPKFFDNKNYQDIIKIAKAFFFKRQSIPSATEIATYCSTPELKTSLKETLLKIDQLDKTFNQDELYHSTERFLKEKAVYHTMLEVAEDVSKGLVDPTVIFERFNECCSINLSVDIGFDLLVDHQKLIDNLQIEEPTVPSGWTWVDEMLDGGFLENGRSIYVFAGETNVGKSIFLGNIAVNMAKQGKTVLVVSLEMSELMYAKRLAGNLTGIEINNLRTEIPTLKSKLEDHINSNPTGKILIKEFPPSTITANQLGAFMKKIEQKGIKIDALVLDYINLMHSPIGNNSYERVKYATEQVRALSYTHNCPIITATQLNRTGYDTQDPGLDTIGESMGLAMTADAIFSIFQNEEDRGLDQIRLGVMKNRFGPNFGQTEMSIHYPTLTITDGEVQDLGNAAANVMGNIELLANT